MDLPIGSDDDDPPGPVKRVQRGSERAAGAKAERYRREDLARDERSYLPGRRYPPDRLRGGVGDIEELAICPSRAELDVQRQGACCPRSALGDHAHLPRWANAFQLRRLG